MTKKRQNSPRNSQEVRERLIEALRLDLVGPWSGNELAEERLPGWVRPSNWYLTGFLIPSGASPEQSSDIDEDDDLDEIPENSGHDEENSEDRRAAKKGFFPSSMGLSFLVAKGAEALSVRVTWGDYEPAEIQVKEEKNISVWQRRPQERSIDIPLNQSDLPVKKKIPDSGGLMIFVVERLITGEGLSDHIPEGTRSVSVFLVNYRSSIKEEPDRAFVFQPELQVHSEIPFVPRPDLRGTRAEDWDEQTADLHYAETPAYATGHGVSAEWTITEGACRSLRTVWIPSAEVEKTKTVQIPGVELSMDRLGAVKNGSEAKTALMPLVDNYRSWIENRRSNLDACNPRRHETAEELLRLAGVAADRIEQGITMLSKFPSALDAFRMANRAVGRALKKRLKIDDQKWRPFQLAFILLNISGIAEPTDPHRETADLLFFPTGGGKTEAYLGLAAFAMVLRRLRHPDDDFKAGAGVSVIMRYTLRLLTLDQLNRASGLICALELERKQNPQQYGEWPFEIGLWVGKAATPNIMGRKGDGRSDTARMKVRHFKKDPRFKPSPIPLENCPWCGKRFRPDSFTLLPNDDHPKELRIVCADFECDFTRENPLPVVAVDEQIYRRLPAFLIATVDKFATLPWMGKSGALLGGADRTGEDGFYGPAEPGMGIRLTEPVPPPDLIIQDELHLISGPLGTMTGLYESAIEALCVREVDEKKIKPKIVASTATVRRAQDQIQSLFGRGTTQIFPPPGPDRRDSFFARIVPVSEAPARLYVGIAAQGRSPKLIMRRIWLALMAAAEKAYRDAGGNRNKKNPADPYMTVLGYFNSLRELGGARRVIEEQIQNTIKAYGERKRIGEEKGLFQNRKNFKEVVELTSRVPTNKAAEARRRLEAPFYEKQRVDCAIATNMISVGLDIPRLGLMVVMGQPKTHAEYIQATSRVGRADDKPGLVVTMLNVHKPRDRSHYERFRHYHETFYRSVEAGSVTPFSARALDKGLAGALVTLARHGQPVLTPPQGVEHIKDVSRLIVNKICDAFQERINSLPIEDEAEREERLRSVHDRIADLIDSWIKVVDDYKNEGVQVKYQKYEYKHGKHLLLDMLEKDHESEHHEKFRVNRSMRDVEPDVNLFIKDAGGKGWEE